MLAPSNQLTRLIFFLLLLIGINNICAADTVNYKVSFTGVKGELLENVRKHVRIYTQLKENPVISDSAEQRLKKQAFDEIKEALEPYGYYKVDVSLGQATTPNQLIYNIELNQPVIIRSLSIEMELPEKQQQEFTSWRTNYPLKEGNRLFQPSYETAKSSLLSTALRFGYFDARFVNSQIVIDEELTSADIGLRFESGNRYSVSSTSFEWEIPEDADANTEQLIDTKLLESLVTFKEGNPYDTGDLVDTQQNLINTPYFSTVSVQAADGDQSSSTVPIIIKLTPKKRRAYSAEGGVGTDTGVRGGFGYENRRINDKGHNINVRLGASQVRRSLIANYRVPLTGSPKDSLNFFATLEEETGDNREFQQSSLGTELTHDWHGALLKYGLTASREKFDRLEDENDLDSLVETTQTLVVPSVSWEHVVSNDLRFPTQGWSASIALRGTSDSLLSSVSLAQAVINAKFIRPLGKGRLLLRVGFGGTLIDDADEIPESLGFLTGGDDTVRGYSFESIGVENDDDVTVGKNLIVGSVEYQHPITSSYALAAFIDIGDAFNGSPSLKKSVGLGFRWRLPFGSLRLDLASALDIDGEPLRLHFSFGTDL